MKLLVCLDGSDLSRGVLGPAQRLAEAARAEVHLLRVIDPSDVHEVRAGGVTAPSQSTAGDLTGGRLPGGSPARPPRVVEDRDRAFARAQNEALDSLHQDAKAFPGKVACDVRLGKPAEEIVAYASASGADIIAMATHSRRGVAEMVFGSTTRAVVNSGVAPVLVFHPR